MTTESIKLLIEFSLRRQKWGPLVRDRANVKWYHQWGAMHFELGIRSYNFHGIYRSYKFYLSKNVNIIIITFNIIEIEVIVLKTES